MTFSFLRISKPVLRQLVSFFLVGAINTLVGFAVILVLMEWLGWSPVPANMGGYAVGLLVSFLLNRNLTFRDRRMATGGALLFFVAFAIAYSVNVAVLLFAINFLSLHVWIGQGAGIVSYTLLFFVLCRAFVFVGAKAERPVENQSST